jgi:hypothetical protein
MREMSSEQKSSYISYLEALIAQNQNQHDKAFKMVSQTLAQHIQNTRNTADLKFYILFNPEFLLNLIDIYFTINIESAIQKGIFFKKPSKSLKPS